jgi:hypothetical protein
LKYSGKKKRHAVKNAVIISCCCMVLYVSPTFDGRVRSKKIADTAYSIPRGFTPVQDSGYQRYRPEGVIVVQPVKKPKGKKLTEEQKQSNRTVKDECRLRRNLFVERVFTTCTAQFQN